MAKINIKLDKEFLAQLTGSISKSSFDGNKKLQSLFNLINNHKDDNTIDIKEITDFTNSIFQADTNNDGEVDKKELNAYLKQNENLFKSLKIKAKDILEFLNIFKENSDKTDPNNQRITNSDGTYSILFNETIDDNIEKVSKKINYDKNNSVSSIETTEDNTRIITDAEGNILTTQQLKNNIVVSEKKADGLTYYYDNNKIIIKNDSEEVLKEIETLDSGKKIIKEYKKIEDGKILLITTNEDTGRIKQNYLYDDNYKININPNNSVSLEELKSFVNQKISSDTYNLFTLLGKDAINILSQEDDKEFQETYITGMINKIIEIADLVDINADEIKIIQEKIKENGIENFSIDLINQTYSTLFEKIKKVKPEISTSKISNKYYTSKHSYTKCVTSDKIIIIDDKNNKTIIDKNQLFNIFSENYKDIIWESLEEWPAEALLDLGIEATFMESIEGTNCFIPAFDKISVEEDMFIVRAIQHELGHAVDYIANDVNAQTDNNVKFKEIFQEEMIAYKKDGNEIYGCGSKNTLKSENNHLSGIDRLLFSSTYATQDKQEMFAECYALLMWGRCNSEAVISKYFPKTRDCVLEIIEKTRELPKQQRHNL